MAVDQDRKALYAAFKAKDTRFDGQFFVGVTSTGIYCRPVCRARMPKEENCRFFAAPAEAEQAGFRPCFICRPELAPGMAVTDARNVLAQQAARFLEENCGTNTSLSELAGELGCTDRHLRRVFAEAYHVSPVQYLQTCRLLLAKSLLTDTSLPVLEVAMAAGFGSLRRFNDLFRKQYRLSPTDLRRQAAEGSQDEEGIHVAVGYHPPYQWQRILRFLSERAIPGVELVEHNEYRRTVRLSDKTGKLIYGWIKVANRPKRNALAVTLSESLLPVLPQLLARVKDLFDLYCDPQAVSEVLSSMNDIKPGLFTEGIRVPGCVDPFELSVRAVLGQQITVKAAGTLAGRMASAFGPALETGEKIGLTRVFPSAGDIAALDGRIEDHLGPLGIIASRARAIQALAQVFSQSAAEGKLIFNPEEKVKELMGIPGIGAWTATYIAMRALRWPDAMPAADLGIKKALGGISPKEITAMAEQWRPWRSYAAMGIWDFLHEPE